MAKLLCASVLSLLFVLPASRVQAVPDESGSIDEVYAKYGVK